MYIVYCSVVRANKRFSFRDNTTSLMKFDKFWLVCLVIAILCNHPFWLNLVCNQSLKRELWILTTEKHYISVWSDPFMKEGKKISIFGFCLTSGVEIANISYHTSRITAEGSTELKKYPYLLGQFNPYSRKRTDYVELGEIYSWINN